ncbi:hypothetical protein FQN57_001313 [Myotisia sp. PD_48]|nr:hypothetical protein FQN57_001313 [Myotisia sp. PD_48]
MPTISLYPCFRSGTFMNPLPGLLQTPSGLAVLELQGTINLPATDPDTHKNITIIDSDVKTEIPLGRLIFAEHDSRDPNNLGWMKRVYLNIGHHQRLSGEVKKLSKPYAIIKRPEGRYGNTTLGSTKPDINREQLANDQLKIVGIVKYKILFSSRPEPVSNEQ